MRKLIAATAVVAAGVGIGSVASAAPTKTVETYVCDGRTVQIAVAGRSGWIDGTHYLAHNLVVVGSFDPTGPAPAEPFSDTQWTSGRTGGLQCRQVVTNMAVEGGTQSYVITLNAIATGK